MKIEVGQPGKLSVIAVVAIILCLCLGAFVFVLGARDFLLGTEVLVPRSAWPASTDEYLDMARSRVHLGDERAKVIQVLSDAWYHGVCDHSSGVRPFIDDVFVYGPRDPNHATVIIIRSEPNEDEMKVFDISIIESDLYLVYSECLPPDFVTAASPP
jgi:hypothetical protein